MAAGLTLEGAALSVFVIDRQLPSDKNIEMSLEALGEMNAKIYSNTPKNNFKQMTIEQIAKALNEFDAVIPY